ncbi:MAG: HAD family phosphatase [Actinomycetota bacterium]|nr:HAD family phosphatase [Actinomycetota bacterium]
MPVRAVIFDFNGTLSHDEPILCEIFCELFAQHGRPLSAQEYFDELAGLSDPEIVRAWLGRDHPSVDEVIQRRIARYCERVADGSSVPEAVRAAVRYAADRVPVAIVSGAARVEIEPVIRAAGLAAFVGPIVAAEDVAQGKPHPAGYLRALTLLDDGLNASDVLVFEDTEAGIASANAAGIRCIAVLGTLAPERLAAADEIVPAIDVELMQRLFG